MSDARPYTTKDLHDDRLDRVLSDSRIIATVEALEKAEAALTDTTRALHEKCEACEVGRGLQDRAEKAEAERDEWKRAAEANMALAERNADTIDRLCDERDEARAEVAKLREAIKEKNLRAYNNGLEDGRVEAARLREALVFLHGASGDTACYCRTRDICQPCDRMILAREQARAALAGTSDEWLRALVTRAVEAAKDLRTHTAYWTNKETQRQLVEQVVEEVLHGKA